MTGEAEAGDKEILETMMGEAEAEDKKILETKVGLSEITITNAMLKMASYIRLNFEKISMAEVRRLLEEDLELEKNALNPYKNLISEKVVEILKTKEISPSLTKLKKSSMRDNLNGKEASENSHEENSDHLDNESLDIEESDVEVKPKMKNASKGQVLKRGRKSQSHEKEPNMPTKKQKSEVAKSEIVLYNEGSGDINDNNLSEASDVKSLKGKEVRNPAYEKHVELLRSVIKSCGMRVPPAIYRRIKQVPEDKREACLIKELEKILSREGLSANSSDREIKNVKKKKEKEKELEGIDMSNIVVSSRRRSATATLVSPPVLPKSPVESDEDGNEDSDGDEDDSENDDGDDDDNNEESDGKDDETPRDSNKDEEND